MGKNIKENIRLAIIIVISMIIGSVFTMFIKENNNSVNYSYSSKDRKEFNSLYETYDTIMKDYYKSVDSKGGQVQITHTIDTNSVGCFFMPYLFLQQLLQWYSWKNNNKVVMYHATK